MKPEPRIFLDTSAIFAGIWSSDGGGRMILKLGEAGALQLITSRDLISELERAIELNPNDLDSYFIRGFAYLMEVDKDEEAIGDFNKVIEIDPENVEAAVRQAVNRTEAFDSFDWKYSRVLIKPNLLLPASPEKGILTHPFIVRATTEYVLANNGIPVISDADSGVYSKTRSNNS